MATYSSLEVAMFWKSERTWLESYFEPSFYHRRCQVFSKYGKIYQLKVKKRVDLTHDINFVTNTY